MKWENCQRVPLYSSCLREIVLTNWVIFFDSSTVQNPFVQLLLNSVFLDRELANLSHVSKSWRKTILDSGAPRRRLNRLDDPQLEQHSIRLLTNDSTPFDSLRVLCHTNYLSTNGVVYGWGSTLRGQLPGIARFNDQSVPTKLDTFGIISHTAAGTGLSFAIKQAKLVGCGWNYFNQLGAATNNYQLVWDLSPGAMPALRTVDNSSISTFAIDIKGHLWSWGSTAYGLLGRASNGYTDGTPQRIDYLLDYKIKQVASGHYQTVCLTIHGEVFTWGHQNYAGQGSLAHHLSMPLELDIEKICQIACGYSHTLLLSADQKTIWSFGSNSYRQLGRPHNFFAALTPVKVPFSCAGIITKIACCDFDSAVLSSDGKITVFGSTWNGGLFAAMRTIRLDSVVDISIGSGFMLALTSDNCLYAFGNNDEGQCGQGYISDEIPEPVRVKNLPPSRIMQLSAGHNHCLIKCALF